YTDGAGARHLGRTECAHRTEPLRRLAHVGKVKLVPEQQGEAMPTERLIITHEGAIARITLNRPEVRNAFDEGLIEELTSALKRIEGEPRSRMVVLSANGKSFCAGADLNWMRRTAGYSWEENFTDAKQLGQLMQTLDQLALPTLAQVQ